MIGNGNQQASSGSLGCYGWPVEGAAGASITGQGDEAAFRRRFTRQSRAGSPGHGCLGARQGLGARANDW